MTDQIPKENSGKIICPQCGSECSPKAIVCKVCSMQLKALSGNAMKTMIVSRPEGTPLPDDGTGSLQGTSRFTEGSVLYFSIERVNSPVARYVRTEPFIIGREETTKLNNEDLNLTPYNAVERGVSRQHALVYYVQGEVFIEDMDSSNGTYLNGDVLEPRKAYKLRDGDELMLGRMMLWVNF